MIVTFSLVDILTAAAWLALYPGSYQEPGYEATAWPSSCHISMSGHFAGHPQCYSHSIPCQIMQESCKIFLSCKICRDLVQLVGVGLADLMYV